MKIMTLTRQLNAHARPVTFAVVSEKDVVAQVPADATPEQRASRIDMLMRERLGKYQKEFMEEFVEFRTASFHLDVLDLNDGPVEVMTQSGASVQM